MTRTRLTNHRFDKLRFECQLKMREWKDNSLLFSRTPPGDFSRPAGTALQILMGLSAHSAHSSSPGGHMS